MQAQEVPIATALKLSLLWAALIGLYIYNDYFSMYLPGEIDAMRDGIIGPAPATQLVMVTVGILLAIPALMIALSSILPRSISRWANIGLGAVYTVVEALTFPGSALFYQITVVLEICVTISIMAIAWTWKPGK